MSDLEFGVLGPVRVLRDGQQIQLSGKTAVAVLAALLLSENRPVPGEILADLVWDGGTPGAPVHWRAALHSAVSRLRRQLGREVVEFSSYGYQIRTDPGRLDLLKFDELVAAADTRLGRGEPEKSLALLDDAARLWRGPALENVGAGRVRRDMAPKLTERFLDMQEQRAELALSLGHHRALADELAALSATYPFRERLAGSLMVALYRSGRQADSLAVYERVRRNLADELGIDPGTELQDLQVRILRADPGLRLHGRQDFVVPDGTSAIPQVPRQLPADIADFAGRERDLEAVHRIVSGQGGLTAGPRIVVVAGPGGAGKSALGVRAAHRLQPEYPDGQLYVDLQGGGSRPVEPGEVLSRFLRAFGIVGAAIPGDLHERSALFRSVVASRRVLILLDSAAGAGQVRQLLPGSPLCGVIVTARGRISGLPGGQIIQLGMLEDDEATRLLAHLVGESRVRSEPAQAQALAALCGGLPLALRIAGARLAARPHWRLADLLDRLGDRHRRLSELTYGDLSVRASLALSYQGLPATAAMLLRRISLLGAPDVPVWVAAALLDTSLAQAADVLESLVEAQLLEVVASTITSERRFRCHDLTWAFSRERSLADDSPADRDDALRRGLGALLGLAEHAHCRIYGGNYGIVHGHAGRWQPDVEPPDLVGPDPVTWLEGERLLLVAGIREAAAAGLDELCWDLAWTAVTLFEVGSYLEDWGAAVEQALSVCRRAGNQRGEAAMTVAMAGWLLMEQSYASGLEMSHDGGRLFTQIDDQHGQALAHRVAGLCELRSGQLGSALARFALARTMGREAGDRFLEIAVLRDMAGIYLDLGEYSAVRACLADALSMSREIGSARAQALVLHKLGQVHLQQGHLADAAGAFERALEFIVLAKDRIGEAYVRLGLGDVELARENDAQPLLREVLHAATQMGDQFLQAQALLSLGVAEQRRGDHAAALRSLRASIEITSRSGIVLWQARALHVLAASYRAIGALDDARRAAEEASQLRASLPRRPAIPVPG
jgi:DNA-binding SARP family transcriptional activator/tetratricopeptide (TPR) repeat protein